MPFRPTFDCLWCGTTHATRTPDDVEGWALLCPDCIGRAGENGFLRFRLRAALEERGRARSADRSGSASRGIGAEGPAVSTTDDWYLRRGRFAAGAIADAAWAADLDDATLRIDAMPLRGRIVEAAAGTGWWSPLLAGRGELWAHVGSDAELERVRTRLVAHRLRAHIHVGQPELAPRSIDAVFAAFHLGGLDAPGRAAFLARARGALRPGGALVAIDLAPADRGAQASVPPGPAFEDGPRPLDPEAVRSAMSAAGFGDLRVERVGRSFVLSLAVVPLEAHSEHSPAP